MQVGKSSVLHITPYLASLQGSAAVISGVIGERASKRATISSVQWKSAIYLKYYVYVIARRGVKLGIHFRGKENGSEIA